MFNSGMMDSIGTQNHGNGNRKNNGNRRKIVDIIVPGE